MIFDLTHPFAITYITPLAPLTLSRGSLAGVRLVGSTTLFNRGVVNEVMYLTGCPDIDAGLRKTMNAALRKET